MVMYNCPRCGFRTEYKSKRFTIDILARKCRSCQPLLENVSISECFQTIISAEKTSVSRKRQHLRKKCQPKCQPIRKAETSAASAEMSAAKFSIALFVIKNLAKKSIKV